MEPSYTYSKRRREKQLRRMATMRAAKERKRMAESCVAKCVGVITFDGPMFGGDHTLRCLFSETYSERHLMIEIDDVTSKPRTVRGVFKLLAKRLAKQREKEE